uniref:Uncharacterized protein n=1 Tax=Rhizophora mucronata TaxID=61149 RepID=A0A2P2NMH4_RHIMU
MTEGFELSGKVGMKQS